MKREIIFHDKKEDKVKIEIELKENRFSMSGEHGGGCGQCQDSVKPTPNQKKLVDIWNTYHLNDMNAGTIKQEKVLTDYKEKNNKDRLEYEEQILILDSTSPELKTLNSLQVKDINNERDKIKAKIHELKDSKYKIIEKKEEIKTKTHAGWFAIKQLDIRYCFHSTAQLTIFVKKELKKRDKEIQELQNNFKIVALKTMLYDKHPDTGEPYNYGSGWLTRELPKDLWQQVNNICDVIETDEKKRKQKYSGGSWDDLDLEIQAIGKFLEMTPKEAEVNIEATRENQVYTAEGIDYIVGTDDEINEYCTKYLTDDSELYGMWVEHQIKEGNASGIMNIDDWAEYVINSDGYGATLNGWDGTEHWDDDLKLYVIRR